MNRRPISPLVCGPFLAPFFLVAALLAEGAERTPDVWARAVHHEDGSRTESVRDVDGQLIEAKTFDKNDQLLMKRVLQTDTKGVPKRGFVFDRKEKLVYRLAFEYDEIGRAKITTLSDPTGKVLTKVQHNYDGEGRALTPTVQTVAPTTQLAGQIRQGAAMAQPGSTEAVLEVAPPVANQPEAPAKKKKGLFKFFKKK
jgi:hypothetical protein